MKKNFITAVIVVASSQAVADNTVYIGAGGQLGTFEQTNTADFDGADFTALQLTLGAYVYGNHALEVRLTSGMSGEEFTHSGDEQTLQVSDAMSVFYRYDFELTKSTKIYPLVGFTEADFDVVYTSSSNSDYTIVDSSGLSYGLGVNTEISEDVKIYAEYISYFSDDKGSNTIDYTGFSAGVNFLFD
ncbi:glycyl-tRNA synthetase [Marinomonas sp. MED121]|uniref:outer membrane beta-barrel protein n=1 Tax=Marinomonas sp. MED121 TaxID=314277 RepID=UPI000069104E|nr:outer membrane beta-barrel protein [Marinomonas sp. MED121]EAQ67780.1 glycyl-tRNA synthetase [Marinomonas sp. MED121]